ncbi:MAG: PASTA domain-containing protein [Desulfarculus sp.]|nr:PASTA domain-containing protein [Pseudomonadota bacterium]MBV1715543.1 PASTA domain-containing protein [Desulfarculus sp.]MBU4575382.1 PASTA domain-containing protein [Pseudomonadota bacterium]MBU4599459.1 PASTA domain-containing protein [Pseudomonadota bacterium]MBV1740286.1 PASTA domain-containing protein [Desulfarculus sp.]
MVLTALRLSTALAFLLLCLILNPAPVAASPDASMAALYARLRGLAGQMMAIASSREWDDHKEALQRMRADREQGAQLTTQVVSQAWLFNQALVRERDLLPLSKQVQAQAAMLSALYSQAARQAKTACASEDKARITAEQMKLQKALEQAASQQKELEAAMGRADRANAWLRANWPKLKALADKGRRAHELYLRADRLDRKFFGMDGGAYYYFEAQRERIKSLSEQVSRVVGDLALAVVAAGGSAGPKERRNAAMLVEAVYEAAGRGSAPPRTGNPAQDDFLRQGVAILAPAAARLKKEPMLFNNTAKLQPPGIPEEHERQYVADERHTELLKLLHIWQQCQDAPALYGGAAQALGAVREARTAAQAAAQRAEACFQQADRRQKALLAARCPEHAFAQWDQAQGRAVCACDAGRGWVWNNDRSACLPLALCRKLWAAHAKFAAEGNREQAASTLATISRRKCPGQAQLQAQRVVPRLVGMSAKQAAQTLAQAGLRYEITSAGLAPRPEQAGRVAGQSPGPGASAKAGSLVTLSVHDLPTKEPAQAAKQRRCEQLAQAYNQALEKNDRQAAYQAVGQAQGCSWQAKAQAFLRCHDLSRSYDAAFIQAQKSQNLGGMKNILTQARGCYWYDKGRSKALCLRAGLIFDRNVAARQTQEAGKALAYARQNNCYWREAGERIYAQAVRQAPVQAAPSAPQTAPTPQQARRLTPQEECRRMNETALRACQSGGSMDRLNAVFNPMARRWQQLGCKMSPALDQCVDAVMDREIGGIFKGWRTPN